MEYQRKVKMDVVAFEKMKAKIFKTYEEYQPADLRISVNPRHIEYKENHV